MANYPTQLDNDGSLLFAKNFGRSPLASSMTNVVQTIPVTDVTQFPTPYGFVAKPGAASAAAAAGSNLGIGIYKYQITFVTSRDGSTFETEGGTEFTATTTGGNQSVSLTSIPTSGSSFVTQRKIYRTAVGGLSGTEKLVTTIADNVATSFTDTASDASISGAAAVTTTNSTGATYFVVIDAVTSATREICAYTGVDTGGNLLTGVTRGQRGTSNFAHASGIVVEQNIVDAFHEFLKAAIVAVETKVGIDASSLTTTMDYKLSEITGGDKAVGKSATQTLTNKTLTSPTISSPTISGTAVFTGASPLSIANAQTLTVSVTAQTSGAATLTVPNFAGVSDTFVFITLAQTLSNKTLASPTLSGTVAGTPAWASSQAITLSTAAQPNITSLGTLTSLTVSTGAVTINTAGTATFNRQYFAAKFAVTFSATPTIDFNNSNVQSMTLTGNITTLTFSNPQSGGRYILVFTQDGTGGRTIAWPAAVKWSGGTAPTLSLANKIDVVGLIYDGTNYYGTSSTNY